MVPGKSFLIAGVLALSGIMAGVLAVPRGPTPAPAAPAPVVTKAVFGERFDWPLLKKQDRLPLPVATEDPEPVVKTEPVAMAMADEPVEVKRVARKKPVAREHNVCTRHHLHKVRTHGGRSWRCRR